MFDIGFGEMILLLAIVLIAVGPKQLPEVARTLGKVLNEFKRATGNFTRALTETRDSVAQEIKPAENERSRSNVRDDSTKTPDTDGSSH
jgi:Tat protein translocase TatB subunit